jgi:hypothetical protein
VNSDRCGVSLEVLVVLVAVGARVGLGWFVRTVRSTIHG